MTTTTTTTTTKKAPKAIDIKPQAKVKEVKDGTKVHALIAVLKQSGGATLSQCAKALSFKGTEVNNATARQWLVYDLCKIKGYGIKQDGEKLTLLTPKAKATKKAA